MNGYYVTIETSVTYTAFIEADNPNPTDIDSVTVKDAEE